MTQRTAKPGEPRESAPVGLEILARLGPVHVTDADTREIRRLIRSEKPYVDHPALHAGIRPDQFDQVKLHDSELGPKFLCMNYARRRALFCLLGIAAYGETTARLCELLIWVRLALRVREEIILRSQKVVYAVIHRLFRARSKETIADQASIGTIALIECADKFDAEKDVDFRLWAFGGIKADLSYNERKYRRKMRRPQSAFAMTMDQFLFGVDAIDHDRERWQWLSEILHDVWESNSANLTDNDREALELCYGLRPNTEPMMQKELAKQIGLSISGAGQRVQVARRKLYDAICERIGEIQHRCQTQHSHLNFIEAGRDYTRAYMRRKRDREGSNA